MQVTLEEQIKGLETIATSSAEQFKARNATLATLRKLVTIRDNMAKGDASDKVANDLIEACGLRTPPPERGS